MVGIVGTVAYRVFFFFQAEDGIRDYKVTGVQTCALPIYGHARDPAGAFGRIAFLDQLPVAEEGGADVVLLEVEGEAGDAVLELQHLERDRRSEEHTSELQSPCNLVCRLLLEKKKKTHVSDTFPPASAWCFVDDVVLRPAPLMLHVSPRSCSSVVLLLHTLRSTTVACVS